MSHQNSVASMERDIVALLRRHYGRDLVSALVEGSYASGEYVVGQSDYDLVVFVRNYDPAKRPPDTSALIAAYGVEIKPAVKSYDDLKNRILDNKRAKRFVTNLSLVYYKLGARLLIGRDVRKDIPTVKALLERDLAADLREQYYHMTNAHPSWNVAMRTPDEWLHSIMNLSYGLILSSGVVAKKKDFPRLLRKLHPKFAGVPQLETAIAWRSSGRLMKMKAAEKKEFMKVYQEFLGAFRSYVFFN